MKRILILLCCVSAAFCGEIRSQKGDITVRLKVDEASGNKLFWSVDYKDKAVIKDSLLGFRLKDQDDIDSGFSIVKVSRKSYTGSWAPVYGERESVTNNYNEMVTLLLDSKGRDFKVIIRAYDEGAALRYEFPGNASFTIADELTEFSFTGDYPCWAVYSAQGIYSNPPLSKLKKNCERPLVVEIEDGPVAAVGEAALVDFARMRLEPAGGKVNTVKAMLAGEVNVTGPYLTPWRVVMAADNACELAENNFIFENLNKPCAIKDTSWIKPGKVIREVTLTTAGGKACVDFAKKMNLQYIEYDAGWYGHEYDDASDATTVTVDPKRSKGPLDLLDVIRYARAKDIRVIVYVNRRALEKQLDDILPLYKEWGISGIKYGFVQVGSQKWTSWLHEAVIKAAGYQMVVDIHDEYRPTGFSRTYPNLLTQEGIGGNETMPTAEQNLVYPFTRYLCGAADYTICWYNDRVKNTQAHQLAAAVVYYSPLQFMYWYDRPSMYKGEEELEFFRQVPTVWDETIIQQGRIGKYAVTARRSGSKWFVGAMNAVERRQVDIRLDFLEDGKTYTATIYSDGSPEGSDRKSVNIEEIKVDSTKVIKADMAHNGGTAISIFPD